MMKNKTVIKTFNLLIIIYKNLSKVYALIEKNIKLNLRFKYSLLISFITPFFTIFLPLIIMSEIFKFKSQFGPWTISNFIVYQFVAYNVLLLRRIVNEFPSQFNVEKFWQTIYALIIAPSHYINLLLGIFFSQLILVSIPLIFFFILSYLFYPISFFTLISIIIIYLLIALIFSGIGIIIGIFAISNENISTLLSFCVTIIFLFSCLTYPFEMFPVYIQNLINLNPLYYIFDILRLAWIEDNIILTISKHFYNFLVLILCAIFLPFIGVYIFNKVYRKFGIVGY